MRLADAIKDVGRGAAGARALTQEAADAAMASLLDGSAGDVETGAFLMAMRMKGETLPELRGFLQAAHAACLRLRSDRPVLLLPSYNGARRLPNLTPLLALELARAGARVLVHGCVDDPARVTSAHILRDLGLPLAQQQADVHAAWARREPAFMPLASLCPPLQRLLDLRWRMGVRSSAHTVAKMLQPIAGTRCLRVVNTTHPEFSALMDSWAREEAADVMLLRGTEGEPVADPRRQPRLHTLLGGQTCAEACVPAQDGVLAELPLLPRSHDASSTALYIQSVLGGERPAPLPLVRQVQALLAALAQLERGHAEQVLRA